MNLNLLGIPQLPCKNDRGNTMAIGGNTALEPPPTTADNWRGGGLLAFQGPAIPSGGPKSVTKERCRTGPLSRDAVILPTPHSSAARECHLKVPR
jgi:hypothetical protein